MDKSILIQYSDLQEEIKEVRKKISTLENQIAKLETETVKDTVSGGLGGIQHYVIEGVASPQISRKKTLLYSRKATLSLLESDLLEKTNQVEEFIASINDSRMRRIINMRFLENCTWEQVAGRMGGKNSKESVRKQFERFFENM